jgi:4-amino-4-deoxy-L-arabinose transferase-like glycosyltransferase
MAAQNPQLNHTLIATLLVCWLVVLIKLGLPELLPYSEAVTVFRADAVLHHSSIFDQTNFSLSGISSSAKPPLTSFLVSMSMYALGESNFALRFPFAVISLGVLFLMYQVTQTFVPRKFSLFAPVILAGTAFFGYSARTIEPTIVSIFLLLLVFNSILKIEKKSSFSWLDFFLLALTFALTVLNDVYTIVIAVAMVFPLLLTNTVPKGKILASMGVGVAAALTWCLYMFSLYGFPFFQSYTMVGIFPTTFFQKLQNVYSIILNDAPVLLIGFYSVVQSISQLRNNSVKDKSELPQTLQFTALLWFFTAFGVFLFTPTFSSSSAVSVVIPLLLIAVLQIHTLYVQNRNSYVVSTMLTFVLMQTMWIVIKYFIGNSFLPASIDTLIPAFIAIISVGITLFMMKVKHQPLSFRIVHWIFVVMPIFLVGKQFLTNARISANELDGATSVAMFFKQGTELPFIYLYHQEHTFSYDAPQLAWYSKETFPKFEARKTYTPLFLSSTVLDKEAVDALLKPEFYDKPIVYHFLNQAPIKESLIKELSRYRDILTEKPNYIVFGGVDKMKLLFENKDK